MDMKKRLAIFDFDGTLIDTRKSIVFAKQVAMKKMGLPVLDEETCAATIGLSAKIGFKKYYPDLSDSLLDECVRIFREVFEEQKDLKAPELFPNVIETLSALTQHGITCTIATSRNRKSLDGFLEKMDLNRFFSYTLSGNDTALLKPNPDPVLKTLADLHFRHNQTIVIGDMSMDIEMAKGAGVESCGVTYGNSNRQTLTECGANFLIDDMKQLLSLFDFDFVEVD